MNKIGVRCPECGRKVGDWLIGAYRTTCPRCHVPIEFKVYGERRIEDETGVTTIAVTRTEKAAPVT